VYYARERGYQVALAPCPSVGDRPAPRWERTRAGTPGARTAAAPRRIGLRSRVAVRRGRDAQSWKPVGSWASR